jgi:hypothetical protein
MVMLFDRAQGVLLSADALWENGFGLVFPELEGEPAFDDVGEVLDAIAALPVRLVVPGHGRPFDDVSGALERARSRLQGLRSDPARHARHALKVLVKYHVMEEREQALDALLDWAEATPLLRGLWLRHPPAGVASARAWVLHGGAGTGQRRRAGAGRRHACGRPLRRAHRPRSDKTRVARGLTARPLHAAPGLVRPLVHAHIAARYERGPRTDKPRCARRAYSPAAARSAAALSVRSQVNSGSSRPK